MMAKKMAKNLSAGKGVKSFKTGPVSPAKSSPSMTGPVASPGGGFGHSSIPRAGYSGRKRG
jgi:hypothetical protein